MNVVVFVVDLPMMALRKWTIARLKRDCLLLYSRLPRQLVDRRRLANDMSKYYLIDTSVLDVCCDRDSRAACKLQRQSVAVSIIWSCYSISNCQLPPTTCLWSTFFANIPVLNDAVIVSANCWRQFTYIHMLPAMQRKKLWKLATNLATWPLGHFMVSNICLR